MKDPAGGLTFSSDKDSLLHQTPTTEPSLSQLGLHTALQRLEQNTNKILTFQGYIPRTTLTPLKAPEKTQACQKLFCYFQPVPVSQPLPTFCHFSLPWRYWAPSHPLPSSPIFPLKAPVISVQTEVQFNSNWFFTLQNTTIYSIPNTAYHWFKSVLTTLRRVWLCLSLTLPSFN